MAGLSLTGLGLVFIVGAVLAFIAGRLPLIRVILIFIGIILVGNGGHLTGLIAPIIGFLQGILGTVTTWAVGVVVPSLLALVLAAMLIHDVHPKTGKPTRRTFWVAALLAVMITTASTNVAFLNGVGPGVRNGVSNVQSGIH